MRTNKVTKKSKRLLSKIENLDRYRSGRINVSSELKRIAETRSWIKNFNYGSSAEDGRKRSKAPLPDDLRLLRIAGIFDPFTEACLQGECKILNLSLANWEREVMEFDPHLLLIESAWEGKEKEWTRKVSKASVELHSLIRKCNSSSTPVVFWNKEDPIHYNAFITAARLCDYVFTTDIDSIIKYKRDLNHDNIFLLPFAASADLHNPIEKFDRKNKFVFAGAYYSNFDERKNEIDQLLSIGARKLGVDIFDRTYNNPDSKHKFPEQYQQYIIGSLHYSEIDRAYKGYRYGINVNSVKNSQTMTARRVYEQMASNCLTISGYSRALNNIFGSLVISSDDPSILSKRLESLIGSYTEYKKLRLLGLRKIYLEHLYTNRLSYVIQKVFGKDMPPRLPTIYVISSPATDKQRERAVEQFNSQKYPFKKFVIVGDAPHPSGDGDERIVYLSERESMMATMDRIAGDGFVGYFSPHDYYSPTYLTDLAIATLYTDSTAIGKATHYRNDNGTISIDSDGHQYAYVQSLRYNSSIVRSSLLMDKTVWDYLSQVKTTDVKMDNMFSIDEFNYCSDWADSTCPTVDDLVPEQTGLSMTEINEKAESITEEVDEDGKTLLINEFTDRLERCKNPKIRLSFSENDVSIVSSLNEDEKEYVYFRDLIEPGSVTKTDGIVAAIEVIGDGKIDISAAFLYLDKEKRKIGAAFIKPGTLYEGTIPAGTTYIRPGIRIAKAGAGFFKQLEIGKKSVRYSSWLTSTHDLVLTNAYPSENDLYRNVFIHRRLMEYKKKGHDVEVFCFNTVNKEGFSNFEGVDIVTGYKSRLNEIIRTGAHDRVLVHFLTPDMWEVLEKYQDRLKIFVWIHGSEVQPWYRREFNLTNNEELEKAKKQSEERISFWKSMFSNENPNLHFIFVSKYFYEEVTSDVGITIGEGRYSIIHNFIDTELFSYEEKAGEMRKKILSIRPFASAKYANDLSVNTILELSKRDFFDELDIRMIGDGKLFDDILAPVKKFSNVHIEKRFLHQDEIASLHKQYGIFLVPTRMDSQGVSRDEAMSSGLVPITNNITAIPEFVDSSCGILAEPEDHKGMAKGIEMLYNDPELFKKMSRASSERVKNQSSGKYTIDRELELIGLSTMK